MIPKALLKKDKISKVLVNALDRYAYRVVFENYRNSFIDFIDFDKFPYKNDFISVKYITGLLIGGKQ
jgi:hypothetical protein